MCLNWNFKKDSFNIFRNKEVLILKLGQFIEYYIKEIFLKEIFRKCISEAGFRPPFNFDKKLEI